jgi:hypothetical protein
MCGVGLSNMVTLSRVKFKERQSPWALSQCPGHSLSMRIRKHAKSPLTRRRVRRN